MLRVYRLLRAPKQDGGNRDWVCRAGSNAALVGRDAVRRTRAGTSDAVFGFNGELKFVKRF